MEGGSGRSGSPIQKGSLEIMIFHSFARSNYFVQLKYRFFRSSLAASTFAFCVRPFVSCPLSSIPTPVRVSQTSSPSSPLPLLQLSDQK